MKQAVYRRHAFRRKGHKNLETLIVLFAGLAKKGRQEGLLSLEPDINAFGHPVFHAGLRMIIDGVKREHADPILAARIYFAGYRGMRLLEALMIREGLLSLQAAENSALVLEKLLQYAAIPDKDALRERLFPAGREPVTRDIARLNKKIKKCRDTLGRFLKEKERLVSGLDHGGISDDL